MIVDMINVHGMPSKKRQMMTLVMSKLRCVLKGTRFNVKIAKKISFLVTILLFSKLRTNNRVVILKQLRKLKGKSNTRLIRQANTLVIHLPKREIIVGQLQMCSVIILNQSYLIRRCKALAKVNLIESIDRLHNSLCRRRDLLGMVISST